MTETPDTPAPKADRLKTLVADVQRLWKFAVKLGAFLAVVCHVLPPPYRPVCDALASICTGGH